MTDPGKSEPRTAKATAKRKRMREERCADLLTERGWVVLDPQTERRWVIAGSGGAQPADYEDAPTAQ